jgi:N-glycosylase/DNA lyase
MPIVSHSRDETNSWNLFKSSLNNFPAESEEVLPGIKWGNACQMYTPAFWKMQYIMTLNKHSIDSHRLANCIVEEVVMCILGGYGIPSEIGIYAFNELKERGLIIPHVTFQKIHSTLSNPIKTSSGNYIRYRFYNQKSKYIAQFLNRNDLDKIPVSHDIELRNWLLSIDGIGYKTASWITRNWLNSERVAILDIHILRAGRLTGFFTERTLTDYIKLEQQYLNFCSALDVSPSNMDAIIWQYMKKNTKLAIRTLTD